VTNEALHVVTTDERQVLAELRPIKVKQHAAMADLFIRHPIEDLGRSSVALPQCFGEAAIDAIVLLLA
jgi:hypothetical protein